MIRKPSKCANGCNNRNFQATSVWLFNKLVMLHFTNVLIQVLEHWTMQNIWVTNQNEIRNIGENIDQLHLQSNVFPNGFPCDHSAPSTGNSHNQNTDCMAWSYAMRNIQLFALVLLQNSSRPKRCKNLRKIGCSNREQISSWGWQLFSVLFHCIGRSLDLRLFADTAENFQAGLRRSKGPR